VEVYRKDSQRLCKRVSTCRPIFGGPVKAWVIRLKLTVAQYVARTFCSLAPILKHLEASRRIAVRSEQAPWRVQRDSGCNSFMRFQFDGGRKSRRPLDCLANQRSFPTIFTKSLGRPERCQESASQTPAKLQNMSSQPNARFVAN
jgi:hypothetical protein